MIRRRYDDRVIYMIASYCLDYPTSDTTLRLPTFAAALDEQGNAAPVRLLRTALQHFANTDLEVLQRSYVECFDLNGKRALYLSYWTDGDTRRRGEALNRFQTAYRSAAAVVDSGGELPDYLPLVLEFAAGHRAAGRAILGDYRASLEMLRISLQQRWTHHADAVAAVCATLPGASPTDHASAAAMVRTPIEMVGLDSYGGR